MALRDIAPPRRVLRQVLTVTAAAFLGGASVIGIVYVLPYLPFSPWVLHGAGVVALVAALIAYDLTEPTDVLEIHINGPIKRDVNGFDEGVDADDVVDRIHSAAAADDGPDGLLLVLNTPGGAVLPSEDIRSAVADWEGPTAAYLEDTCASGGYLIASAADHLIARPESLVGSIGVIGSRVNAHDFASDLGLDYQQFTAGEFKDAGHPLKEPDAEEERFIQALIDRNYDLFIGRVAGGRGLDREDVEALGARLFLGGEAIQHGLVDALGDVDDAKDHVVDRLDLPVETPVSVSYKAGQSSPVAAGRVSGGLYALGRGLADGLGARVEETTDRGLELRWER